jgi:hypothetical protein
MNTTVPTAPQAGDVPQAIRDLLVPGTKLLRRQLGGHKAQLWHVRAVVDDDCIVFRRYDPKLGWLYFAVDIDECASALANGGLALK